VVFFDSLNDPMLVRMLAAGAVGVLPTDTVYGLVATAGNPRAVQKLYALKSRERKPGTTIAASAEQLIALGVPRLTIERVAKLWPNPLSVVIELDENLAYLHAGVGSSPFRVVATAALKSLLEKTGPLLTSSANLPGQPPATNLAEARRYFGSQVDFYVDGGLRKDNAPSTIIRLGSKGAQVLREGAIPAKKVKELLA